MVLCAVLVPLASLGLSEGRRLRVALSLPCSSGNRLPGLHWVRLTVLAAFQLGEMSSTIKWEIKGDKGNVFIWVAYGSKWE